MCDREGNVVGLTYCSKNPCKWRGRLTRLSEDLGSSYSRSDYSLTFHSVSVLLRSLAPYCGSQTGGKVPSVEGEGKRWGGTPGLRCH